MFGCNTAETKSYIQHSVELYYEYGIREKCANDSNYFMINAIEIVPSYDGETTDSNACYVVLGVETDLLESNFSDSNNMIELRFSSNQVFNLNYVMYDAENGKLVYEIVCEETFDYSQIYNLAVSNSNEKYEYPFLSVLLDCFNGYCTVDEIQYCGKYIIIYFE